MRLNKHEFEFIPEGHIYKIDGEPVPSITQLLANKFPDKYKGISQDMLMRAADKGTAVHKAIQDYCEQGIESDLPELHNFKFLKKRYGFNVLHNERPVFLKVNGIIVAAGTYDMEIEIGGLIGGCDIKRTAKLDFEYLTYQLNLYRIANKQTYGKEWSFLRALHLRDDVRKFIEIPIREDILKEIGDMYL